MKNMKLGTKIGVGFGLLIVVAMVLGGMAVINMKGVSKESTMLAREYVPEVSVGARIRGASNRIMYAMRGYGFTENEIYHKEAIKELEILTRAVGEGRTLDRESENLKKLSVQLDNIESSQSEYTTAVEETRRFVNALEGDRRKLDRAAALYMEKSGEFLEGQNQAFQKDLAERRKKIDLVTDLVDVGNRARVQNFKAQSRNDPDMMQAAIETLNKVDALVKAMRKIARSEADIERMDRIVAAAGGYQAAMEGFLTEFRKGVSADSYAFDRAKKQMDEHAGIYGENCQAFLDGQQKKLAVDMRERHEKISLVNDVIDIGNAARINNFKSQATRDPKVMDAAIESFARLDEKFRDLRAITRLEKDLAMIDAVEENGEAYRQAMVDFLGNWKKLQELGRVRDKTGQEMITAAKTLADAGLEETETIAQSAMNSLNTSSTVMLIGLAVALILGIFLAVTITLSITRPVRRIIDGLNSGADQVASASGQVSASSQTLAEGSSEQASSLEETSSSLEEMASMTRQNAENATQGDTMMKETGKVIAQANDSMEGLSNSMGEISKSSGEISKIIKDIDEIAFQTNLLALNAAVEAARAGEAGAGFAVVADEVRNLAMRAAEAAKNTAELIEDTVKKIDEGAQMTTSARESFIQVEKSSSKVGELVGEITAASSEQTQGIDQINQAVADMDKVTQQNAANAEEAASAAEEMSAQADEMKQIVEELVTMVGASKTGGQGGSSRSRQSRHITGPGQKRASGSGKLSAGPKKSLSLSRKTEVNPKDVIPMDDDDFSDF
ncbi:MAG TPA: methyl-accepting chemotaxis protein [Desulfobacteraceae bacterium]|nr:methyl-accepting chemotaxis protein [Desulfobacteraceae bacterium]